MAILISGGAGYIGSHTLVALLEAGYEAVVFDNFDNSKPIALERVKQITGKDFKFYEVDLLDYDATEKVFAENEIEQAKDVLKRCMEDVMRLNVPLKTDITTGGDWRACK